MVNMLDGRPAPNPYESESNDKSPCDANFMLVLCASEIVKALEILSPQAIHSAFGSDPVMRESLNAFHAAARPNTKFDMLKQELLQQIEPGTSAKDIHPCIEAWTEFQINHDGTVARFEPETSPHANFKIEERWTLPQQAAIRLCTNHDETREDRNETLQTQWSQGSVLNTLFEQEMKRCQAETQTVDYMFWRKALNRLHREHPSTKLLDDDTVVLTQPCQQLQQCREACIESCKLLEDSLGSWEQTYHNIKKNVKRFMSGLEELRLKLWYTSAVLHSTIYADARSIAKALSYMSLRSPQSATTANIGARALQRPGSSRSGVSSILGQRRQDTIELLKAPTDQGGSRKLADGQIESIQRWLRQYGIDNFCKGEERLHRFCMQIQLVAKRLTGDNSSESEELWTSELFQRERSLYDYAPYGINSAPASTRPVSVMSDSFSSSFPVLRLATRSPDSDVRSTFSDERGSSWKGSVYSKVARTLNPQLLTPSLASSMSSHGRASSATTTGSEIFSSMPSQSVTEASVYSRAPSMLSGRLPNFAARGTSSVKEKKKFREQLRKGLVCLLLSDLGCIVWSWGCETDTWIRYAQKNDNIMMRCMKRISTKSLRPDVQIASRSVMARRRSIERTNTTESLSLGEDIVVEENNDDDDDDAYLSALRDVLERLSQHIDPVSKLQACHDFDTIALQQLEASNNGTRNDHDKIPAGQSTRRRSLDSQQQDLTQESLHILSQMTLADKAQPSHDQIVHHHKRQLARLQPKTIFRDLQYIAVFTPSEMLDKTAAGKAFMHIGMAALDYKNELCGSMVDIADKMMAAKMSQTSPSVSSKQPLSRAAEYWMIAAVEGNAVAQRELAMLYLMQPEVLPILTRPLCMAGDVFRDENMWQKPSDNDNNRQAMCLALHWMQQAAENGDEVAQKKLEDRKRASISIR